MTIPTLETASPTMVRDVARDFAGALMQDPAYLAFQTASDAMGKDPDSQSAIQAFQNKQREMQMMAQLNSVTPEDHAEAAHYLPELIGQLRYRYLAVVYALMTPEAARFVSPLTVAAAAGTPVKCSAAEAS